MEPSRKIRVISVSPAPIIRAGLRVLFDGDGPVTLVGEADSPSKGARLAAVEQPDVIVLDLLFDRTDVVDAIPRLLGETNPRRVVIISWHNDPVGDARAIELGASGLVLHYECFEVLIKAIETVHAGELWLNRATTTAVIKQLVRRRREVDDKQARIDTLTRREREIIWHLGEGLNNKAIAERLFISKSSVSNHLSSVLRKLELSSRFELAMFALRHGLVLVPAASRDAKHDLLGPSTPMTVE
jgi:DNA-binding NarL/FixJ family response regulator